MAAGLRNVMLRPLFWAIWRDPERRARKLMQFSAVEASGGRDLVRAAQLTPDPRLRNLFIVHAADEERHARLFRDRATALGARSAAYGMSTWLAPGEAGLDGLDLEAEDDVSLLAFVHLSEQAAARDFAAYRDVLRHDPDTRLVFSRILHDEEFHMRYSLAELRRVGGPASRSALWKARLRRIWKAYLRLAMALADAISTLLLLVQYFILLAPFALIARRAAAREKPGWHERGAWFGAAMDEQAAP